MKYIIFVIDDQLEKASNNEMEAINAFNDKLQAEGNWITAAGINHGEAATVLDNRSGAGLVMPGSLYNDEEHYSGFWLIEAADKEMALKLAAEGSKACNRKVELRPYL
jgi:hypothetical protein